ncbi:D-alanyl-D-alanine carboxypeptidase/D-alanyl-D-alanine-endopeptidase [Streptomyces sp. HNM0663]|uniref:D-alanyl-D-alanine carboxypeptidase/D-alanyl-D-alanine-endopeptidase n=1 Tax=Streptomyces chengmaiensis TaxID=3040919 RepID=A0ABT6HFN6_9ACTN|nr:D-alanyl-D-alanine carboxypeptidase/D-alanyl-D-alanine-endopeptidase [Streptomyces chengmaiensis]MDH2387583.1 D-alanyl-D-alanine carboxypeptidase/D-alanyl-D-alanine-endopeptidase [Streptomyces chengmaiensis]
MVRTWQLATGAAAVGCVLAAGAVAAAGPWDSGQRKAEREWAAARSPAGGAHHEGTAPGPPRTRPEPAPSAPDVLGALGVPDAAALRAPRPRTPSADAPAEPQRKPPRQLARELSRKLDPLLADPGLGPVRTASVVDAATGESLYSRGARSPMTPASTIKIATATAVLAALGPDHRIETAVAAPPPRPGAATTEITLVGGGDATLDEKRLRTLAERTATALRGRGAASVRLVYDASRFSGPARHPIGPNGNIAPVSALMLNQGRLDGSLRGPAPRSADPARDTADAFVRLLAEHGVEAAADPVPGRAPAAARPLASVASAPLSALVERMLTYSDNDLAEALARQTALAAGEQASFAGAERAVTAQLAALGLDVKGARFADGSGLSRRDRVSAGLLTALLARAAEPGRPELRPVLTGLPVAGFSGTLEQRYAGGPPATAAGTGLVRAKTGTLTGVDTLAGAVVAPDGRLLAFAFLTGDSPSPYTTRPALDRLAAALAS